MLHATGKRPKQAKLQHSEPPIKTAAFLSVVAPHQASRWRIHTEQIHYLLARWFPFDERKPKQQRVSPEAWSLVTLRASAKRCAAHFPNQIFALKVREQLYAWKV